MDYYVTNAPIGVEVIGTRGKAWISAGVDVYRDKKGVFHAAIDGRNHRFNVAKRDRRCLDLIEKGETS